MKTSFKQKAPPPPRMASTAIASIIFILAAFLRLASGEILTNSRLLAGDQKAWLSSPNGKFAFGFDGSAIPGGNKYLLAIWFAQLPGDRTLVWSPNRNFPVGDSASLEFSPSGDLLLVDGNNVTVWSSNTSGLGARVAVLLDTGNFILYNDSSHRPLWQSFQHPSDTLLPNQQLTVSQQLTASRPSDEDGPYTLGMVQETDLLSLTLTYSLSSLGNYSGSNYSYWVGPDMSNVTGTVIAVLDDSGSFGILYGDSADGAVFIHQNDGDAKGLMLSVRNGSTGSPYLRRLTLEANGSLRLYRWDDNINGSSQWVPEWAAVSNPCDIAGMCGNGICSFDKTIPNATCKPLPGFTRGRSGTVNESGLCPEYKRSDFKISVIKQTNYYFSDFSVIANYSDEQAVSKCGDVCLSNCECIASVSGMDEEAPYCWLLRSLDFGGFEDSGSTLFVKVRSDSLLAGTTKDVVIPTVAVMAVLLLLLCALLYYSVCKRQYLWSSTECSLLHLSGAPINFSYRDLQIRTSNFSLLLGTGGFGSVYKGSLVDGTQVAVKKLERVLPHGEKEFVTEVNTIGSMHHMNLVRLCGYCSDGPQRLLVYEFMKNGSLDKWIFPSPASSNERLLDWETRFNIAMGTAQGIAYFHEQCRNRIIHCDIKPENILLDENFCPKVSDFGLAKLMGREHSQVMTMVRGTRGYLAPEWISNRAITVKADVYSYGMLLLEIIGGRRNLDMAFDVDNFFYPSLAFKEMMNKTPINVADRRLSKVVKEVELLRALKVAFWCIQDEVFSRPTMGEVVRMLEGLVDVNTPPMPQTVLELVEEGLDQVYRAMRREIRQSSTCTFSITHPSSYATCSYSTMSPR